VAKSSRLGVPEIRQVFRLIGDCRELGRTRQSWVTRAAEGLRDLTASLIVIGGFFESVQASGSEVGRSAWDVGWLSARDRAVWMDLIDRGEHLKYETVQRVATIRGRRIVRSRSQLVADTAWRRSGEFNEDRRPLGQDDTMIGLNHLAGGISIQMFSLNRGVGDRPFEARDRAILRLVQAELEPLFGTHLIVDTVGPIDRLPPRLKSVLEAIVAGDTEKQIALRLGLSRHTVHDYVKALHQKSGASCRADLLAYYYRFQK
jgi:DNA-binding CsgD family transcriptional regulator